MISDVQAVAVALGLAPGAEFETLELVELAEEAAKERDAARRQLVALRAQLEARTEPPESPSRLPKPVPEFPVAPDTLEGTIRALHATGLDDLSCVQNQTVVTDAFKGEDLNRYRPSRFGILGRSLCYSLRCCWRNGC